MLNCFQTFLNSSFHEPARLVYNGEKPPEQAKPQEQPESAHPAPDTEAAKQDLDKERETAKNMINTYAGDLNPELAQKAKEALQQLEKLKPGENLTTQEREAFVGQFQLTIDYYREKESCKELHDAVLTDAQELQKNRVDKLKKQESFWLEKYPDLSTEAREKLQSCFREAKDGAQGLVKTELPKVGVPPVSLDQYKSNSEVYRNEIAAMQKVMDKVSGKDPSLLAALDENDLNTRNKSEAIINVDVAKDAEKAVKEAEADVKHGLEQLQSMEGVDTKEAKVRIRAHGENAIALLKKCSGREDELIRAGILCQLFDDIVRILAETKTGQESKEQKWPVVDELRTLTGGKYRPVHKAFEKPEFLEATELADKVKQSLKFKKTPVFRTTAGLDSVKLNPGDNVVLEEARVVQVTMPDGKKVDYVMVHLDPPHGPRGLILKEDLDFGKPGEAKPAPAPAPGQAPAGPKAAPAPAVRAPEAKEGELLLTEAEKRKINEIVANLKVNAPPQEENISGEKLKFSRIDNKYTVANETGDIKEEGLKQEVAKKTEDVLRKIKSEKNVA